MSEGKLVFLQCCLVSSGAILGTWIRFNLVAYAQAIFGKAYWGNFIVNILASFFLGLFVSIKSSYFLHGIYNSLILFLGAGFLGSMSTFSSFILDILQSSYKGQYQEAIEILLYSLFFGCFAVWIGSAIANSQNII